MLKIQTRAEEHRARLHVVHSGVSGKLRLPGVLQQKLNKGLRSPWIHGVLVITKETKKKQQTLRTFMHHENVNSAGWLQVYLSVEQPMVLKAEQGPEDLTCCT